MRSRYWVGVPAGGLALAWVTTAAAEPAFNTEGGATGSLLMLLTERLEFTLKEIPSLGAHLLGLPNLITGRVALLLVGIVAAGLVAEYVTRLLLSRTRLRGFDRL